MNGPKILFILFGIVPIVVLVICGGIALFGEFVNPQPPSTRVEESYVPPPPGYVPSPGLPGVYLPK